MQEQIESVVQMQSVATRFVHGLIPRANGATVVALLGDLGAGKTTFMQGVAKALGVTGQVTSPTFVLEKVYKLRDQQFDHLIHIDAYRLENAHEARGLGWDELLLNRNNVVCVEWADRLGDAIPENAIVIKFQFVSDTVRQITWPKS